MNELSKRKCVPCEGGTIPLASEEADALLAKLDGWKREDSRLRKIFCFDNYYETMAFVNAVAYVAHREDHHPEMLVGYKMCEVIYTTHAIGGLSENDFICAGILDELVV